MPSGVHEGAVSHIVGGPRSGGRSTPADRHRGTDAKRLAERKVVYECAKCLNPTRWSGDVRRWEVIGPVSLNPGKPQEKERNQKAA